jgi:NADP-dependent 3-hydroxy acid dehydrogenase YdfG
MTSQTRKPEIAWLIGVGASAGLGAAVARRFAREGLTVAVSGRTVQRIEAVAAEIREAGGSAFAVPADVSRESEVEAASVRLSREGSSRRRYSMSAAR